RPPAAEVEQEPGRAWIAVAWLADASRVEDPFALGYVELGAVGRGVARHDTRLTGSVEPQRHVRVADRAHAAGHGGHAGLRLARGEDVLPDRIPGASVVEADSVVLVLPVE